MTKEQQKDKIIEIVKKSIGDNSVTTYGADDMVSIDGDDVDHIAEEVAEKVYDLYASVFGNEIESLKRDIKELQDENAGLNRECNDYCEEIDRLQARNADLKRVNEAIQRATAQDILQQMWDWKTRGTPFIADIQELADRYGVEVEE
nr:MAG TPA: GTPase-activating protein [Caudoviricetes sp.]